MSNRRKTIDYIHSLSYIKDDYDGNKSLAPSPTALEKSMFVAYLLSEDEQPTDYMINPPGDIVFFWENEGGEICLEINSAYINISQTMNRLHIWSDEEFKKTKPAWDLHMAISDKLISFVQYYHPQEIIIKND